jgi:DNA-binding CsgD family transcriptional regulator
MFAPTTLDSAGNSVAQALMDTMNSASAPTSLWSVSNENALGSLRSAAATGSRVLPLRRRSDRYGAGRSDGLEAMLIGALDEIDYGMILIDAHGRVCHANHLARVELGRNEHLCMERERLVSCALEHREALSGAIGRASRGARSLVDLSQTESPGKSLMVAVVPIGQRTENSLTPSSVLVITGKQQICEQISLQLFARRYALSRSEQIVLHALALGSTVQEVATERGLALSTVRSQVKDIRVKTRCKSVRELLSKVSALPPLVSSIKGNS